MTYNIASDIDTRKIVWVNQKYLIPHSSVEVATINRRLTELLTSKSPQ
ncbi:hypothetical protein [Synechococcus phage S-B05]|nr:hypothetical protein [Synechococcus phage S-B05]QCW22861.1 hypothetical protein [Synechococcus phage S-B05]